MKILINDLFQKSTSSVTVGSNKILTPALQDTSTDLAYTVTMASSAVNCICFGNIKYSAALTVTVKLWTATTSYTITINYSFITGMAAANLIYYFSTSYSGIIQADVTFSATLEYIGRVALGVYRSLPVYKAREPEWLYTTENQLTLGGQVIQALGGVAKRRMNVELKCKIDSDIYADFEAAKNYLPAKFPYFIDFGEDSNLFSMAIFYAADEAPILLQSSINGIIYSKKMQLVECY
jgi:hypothetical protein